MRGGLSAFIAGLGEVEFMSLRKPYRSVDEQLRILRSRGMAVDAGAGHVLRREGYLSDRQWLQGFVPRLKGMPDRW